VIVGSKESEKVVKLGGLFETGNVKCSSVAVERNARCDPLVRGSIRAAARVRRFRLRKSNYLKIIPVYMMIREIIPGRQQRFPRCPL